MQVNNISETQPQFKGLLILKNAIRENEIVPQIARAAEVVCGIDPLIDKACISKGAALKTLLTLTNGEKFSLNIPFQKVVAAYQEVAYTNKCIVLDSSSMDDEVSSFNFG